MSETNIQFSESDQNNNFFVHTFGGESYIDDIEWSEYGIQLGDLSISGLTPETTKKLAIILINHLILNGHNFDIIRTGEQDQVEEIIERK